MRAALLTVLSLLFYGALCGRWWLSTSSYILILVGTDLFREVLVHAEYADDISWREYLEDVYRHGDHPDDQGRNITNLMNVIKKSDINFYYKNAHVKVVPLDWPRSYIKASAVHLKDFILSYNPSTTYRSYSWVEVSRFSSTYLWPNFLEGYVAPQWIDYHSNKKVNYGCWFYLSKGSGIYLNLGKTKVITSRPLLWRYFKELVEGSNCLRGDHASNCHDKYLCTAATRHGYDSIQVVEQHEIIMCTGCGATELVQACPPTVVELRSGYNASQSCNCSDDYLLLNCGHQWGSNEENQDSRSFHGSSQNSSSSSKCSPTYFAPKSSSLLSYRPITCVSREPTTALIDPYVDFNVTLLFMHSVTSNSLSKTQQSLRNYASEDTGRLHYVFDITMHDDGLFQVKMVTTATDTSSTSDELVVNSSEVIDFHNEDFDVESPTYRRRDQTNSRLDDLTMHFSEKRNSIQLAIKSMLVMVPRSSSNDKASSAVVSRLGIIGYYLNNNINISDHISIRQLKDEVSCLRVLGCNFIVLLASGSYIFEKHGMIAQYLKGYIDVILVYMPIAVYDDKASHVKESQLNSSDEASHTVPVVLLKHDQAVVNKVIVHRLAGSIGTVVKQIRAFDIV